MSRQTKALAIAMAFTATAAVTAAPGIEASAAADSASSPDPALPAGLPHAGLQSLHEWLGGPIPPKQMHRKEREAARLVLAAEAARTLDAKKGTSHSTLGPLSVDPFHRLLIHRAVRTRLGSVKARLNVLAGHTATVAGTLRPGRRGRTVELQLRHRHHWIEVAHARTRHHGRYLVRYRPATEGERALRIRFPGAPHLKPSVRRVGQLDVYQLAVASWYGGGGTMACGGELTSSTLGVANKTLPCGTMIRLRYGGRSVRVPVVDRGPYVAGREFDLTEATKDALGFEGVGTVWSMD